MCSNKHEIPLEFLFYYIYYFIYLFNCLFIDAFVKFVGCYFIWLVMRRHLTLRHQGISIWRTGNDVMLPLTILHSVIYIYWLAYTVEM